MRLLLLGVAAVLALFSVAASAQEAPAVQAMSAEAADAAKVVDAFHAALRANDAAGAVALLVDDAMIFEAGHAERSKAEYAGHHAGADAAYESAAPSKLERRGGQAKDGLAWIASETRTTGRYKDKPVDRITTETMVLVKTANGWRITHIHWSSRNAS